MRKIVSFCLLALLAVSLIGCTDEEISVAGNTYVYEGEGFGGLFTITLQEDGKSSYYEGMLSSYLGFGTWVLEGDIVTITDGTSMPTISEDGSVGEGAPFVNRFRVRGNTLIFLADGSRNFLYVKVPDGGKFHKIENFSDLPAPAVPT